MKPCYIHGREDTQIKLDGPALRIHTPGKAAILAPLGRISRIVISGSPDCSSSALLACAERGITVTFLQRDGAIRALLFGTGKARNNLLSQLRDFLGHPAWQEHYQLWRDSAASHAKCAVCRKLDIAPDRISSKQLRTSLGRWMEDYVSPGQRSYLQRRLHGLCASLVNEVLQQAGLDATRSSYIAQRIDLTSDFAELLALSMQLPLIMWLSRQPEKKRIEDRDIVALFERQSKYLERVARQLTGRFYKFLIDIR